MVDVTSEDLRAAVGAGVLSEAQAASLAALAAARSGYRTGLAAEDEPFEFFKGFNEIFVTIGLILLFAGVYGIMVVTGGPILVPFVSIFLAWGLAEYFARRRRMVLPSVLLSGIFAATVCFFAGVLLQIESDGSVGWRIPAVFVLAALGTFGFYIRFRVPVTLFVIGILLLLALLSFLGIFDANAFETADFPSGLLDLRQGSSFALSTLVFGLAAFAVAMGFDLRDPHRLSRLSACGFWLHLLAAPAIVNTVAFSLWSIGGSAGYALTALALGFIAFVALVIDRRSFLTAGIVYLGALVGQALGQADGDWSLALTFLVLGLFITGLGAAWARLRAVILGALPDFPGKDRLPPWELPA